ncbi:hypothetical protein MBLNU457_g0507t1 [Dothideomycetes sp. NU457]
MPNSSSTSRQPIQEVVNTAFDKADATSQIDPNLVAQITEQVIKGLKASGITGGPIGSQTTQFVPQNAQSQPTPLYQPQPLNATRQPPPELSTPASPASSSYPARYTPPSRTSSSGSSSHEPPSGHQSYPGREPKSSSRRDSKASASGSEDTGATIRPRPARVPSTVEETTLEKIWKPLFDNDGRPTPRLGQLLRGLAKHLVEDYAPKQSIIITPGKLADFFKATRVPDELYPWNAIFGGGLTNASISRLFRDLRCQHHLMQFNDHDVPIIPGLTAQGFDTFMTTLIQAHPDKEFERLSNALRNMPISNADDCKERFPKELSKRLFPQREDLQQQQRLYAALSADPAIPFPKKNTMPPPPPTQPPSVQHSSSTFGERERNPYEFSFSAVDDEDIMTSVPIERVRKPYYAREGGGKIHEQDEPSNTAQRPEPTTTRSSRTNSYLQQPQHIPARPTDIPRTGSRSHRNSMSGAQPSSVGTRRYGTSPSSNTTNIYTRSEGTNISDIPASQYASNMRFDKSRSEAQATPRRHSRRSTDEELAKAFGVPTRTFTSNGSGSQYDKTGYGGTDGYGSLPLGQGNGIGYGGYPAPPLGPRY